MEGKLFGLGAESYTVGSHEFYLGYAVANQMLLCLDAATSTPPRRSRTRSPSVLLYLDEILLHVSRGVRWDSDHVVILSDDLQAIAQEIVRGDYLDRVHIGLDYFDASINRIAAWAIGTRNMQRALLMALLEPTAQLAELERAGDFTGRLALLEELKGLPAGAVWDYLLPAARSAGGHGFHGARSRRTRQRCWRSGSNSRCHGFAVNGSTTPGAARRITSEIHMPRAAPRSMKMSLRGVAIPKQSHPCGGDCFVGLRPSSQ